MKARVYVTLKNGVLDPQGQAIERALKNNHIDGIREVKQGKFFEMEIENANDADKKIKDACEKLLANTVIENYRFELVG